MKTKLLWAVAAIGLIGYLFYSAMAPNVVSCEVCVTYGGRTDCRKASGKDQAEAERTAAGTACSMLASGIDGSIACQNTPPSSSTCQNR